MDQWIKFWSNLIFFAKFKFKFPTIVAFFQFLEMSKNNKIKVHLKTIFKLLLYFLKVCKIFVH
jgi:hypothetical protein